MGTKPDIQMGALSANAIRASRKTSLHKQAAYKTATSVEPLLCQCLLSGGRPYKRELNKRKVLTFLLFPLFLKTFKWFLY
ncbi:hypothetical protein Pnap_1397 [Polaromonas naphthalenivorans CJ2]|uniref:Uncharacterized protein n=1 Tax=Polaromonas naphthalenivorans (strain CJ2) TaxID=365044 RepID=A1VM33_POLNA|nr:hypothetical protein Pnap_1397 [Polaromonas naphthalenivorans CJ2]